MGAASLAAIELGGAEERRCPHCGAGGAVSRGQARGLRRFRCQGCGKACGALTGPALSGLRRKERWLAWGASLAAGETVKASAERCGIAPSTAPRWPDRLAGIVEAGETFVLESRKGARQLERKPRRRGGQARQRGLAHEQVPTSVAADRGGATLSRAPPALQAARVQEVPEPALAPEAWRGSAASRRHSRIKGFLRGFRDIAAKGLDRCLRWFPLLGLGAQPAPRACLEAAMRGPAYALRIEPRENHVPRA